MNTDGRGSKLDALGRIAVVAASLGPEADGLSKEEERQRLLGLEQEARRSSLTGTFVSGKRRHLLKRPMGTGKSTTIEGGRRAGRNEPCPCGSGRKYKACCFRRGRIFVRRMKVIDHTAGKEAHA